jgi:hypothetical protein
LLHSRIFFGLTLALDLAGNGEVLEVLTRALGQSAGSHALALNPAEQLIEAAKNGLTQEVERLLTLDKIGHKIGSAGEAAILCAAEKGHVDVVGRLLLLGRINADAHDDEGQNALMLAARSGKMRGRQNLAAAWNEN